MAGRAVYLKRQRVLLGVGVGGHNGGGGGVAAGGIGAELGGGFGDALGERLQTHRLTDDPCGGRQNVVFVNAQRVGDQLAGVLRQFQTAGCAGVGVAAVDQNGAGVAVLQVGAVHLDGCAVDLVGGVAARPGAADIGDDQRQIALCVVMPDAAMHPGGRKPLGRTDAARDNGEGCGRHWGPPCF